MVRNYIPKRNGRAGRKVQPRPSVAPWPCKRCGGQVTSPGSMSSLNGKLYCTPECRIAYQHENEDGQRVFFCRMCKTKKTRTHFATSIATRQRIYSCGDCAGAMMAKRRVGPYRYRTLKSQAKMRGIAFELTVPEWQRWQDMPCLWCGTPLDYPRLDRLDSDGPYSVKNCVPACFFCNRSKGSAPPEAWLAHTRAIARKHPNGPVEPYLSPNYNPTRKRIDDP